MKTTTNQSETHFLATTIPREGLVRSRLEISQREEHYQLYLRLYTETEMEIHEFFLSREAMVELARFVACCELEMKQ